VAESRAQAVTTIRPYAEWLYQNRPALGHNLVLPEADRFDVPFEQILADRFIISSPAECAAEVARYQAVGVEELIMRCQWPDMPLQRAQRAAGGCIRKFDGRHDTRQTTSSGTARTPTNRSPVQRSR